MTAEGNQPPIRQIQPPVWLRDIERLLPVRSQFILSGNIRDCFLSGNETAPQVQDLVDTLWLALEARGFSFILVYDKLEGLRVVPDLPATRAQAGALLNVTFDGAPVATELNVAAKHAQSIVHNRTVRVAWVMDFASRIAANPQEPLDDDRELFLRFEKLASSAQVCRPEGSTAGFLYNPVLWLLNRMQDMPSWFALDNEKVHSVEIGLPGLPEREFAARALIGGFLGADTAPETVRSRACDVFASGADGMTLASMRDIAELANYRAIKIEDVDDAIRSFRVGGDTSPWKSPTLRRRIAAASVELEERVKGQRQAVVKTSDILIRSVMGLTGAQAKAGGGRPRGVLFFAGPTGVGKTELAKSLTELLFGDESSYIRFDMSEFSEEHAAARLMGAPPGYMGYDAGGELTNKVRQKPFSVVLFDEIEKAHPRILDKFLQILEDGRLTDGRGDTVYFSECVIIFTSNLGIYVQKDGARVQNVSPSDPYEQVEERVRNAIGDYFKFQLGRPEILNRIGDNIVVFNFIRPDVAHKIFEGMLTNVFRRVREEHGLALTLSDEARQSLLDWCTSDLSHGGRGIGNRLETCFINPLARALFPRADLHGAQLCVNRLVNEDYVYKVEFD